MKRLVICCDGTMNRLDAEVPTNVVKLAANIAPVDSRGIPQIVYYDHGVATDTGLFHEVRQLLEGAFGFGLDENIEEAYRFLCMNYVPGDEIYVFGFSRGAFTARSLCGLVRKCGILRRDRIREAPDAVRYYRNKERASSKKSQAFREKNSRGKVGAEDVIKEVRADLREGGVETGEATIQDAAKVALAHDDEATNITYVGIWETVGSLGVPNRVWFSRWLNRRYRFHDTDLSSLVLSARHAVAIDERRDSFAVVPWSNLDELNHLHGPVRAGERDFQRYRQVWFPGDHGCVGGGTATTEALSSIPLQWVADGAALMGLQIQSRFTTGWASSSAVLCGFEEPVGTFGKMRAWLLDLPGVSPRKFHGDIEDVSDAAVLRWSRMEAYRPATLSRFEKRLMKAAAERGLPDKCDPS